MCARVSVCCCRLIRPDGYSSSLSARVAQASVSRLQMCAEGRSRLPCSSHAGMQRDEIGAAIVAAAHYARLVCGLTHGIAVMCAGVYMRVCMRVCMPCSRPWMH